MEMLPAKIRDENCAARYSRELRNQNGKHLVNLYESTIFGTQVIVNKPELLYK